MNPAREREREREGERGRERERERERDLCIIIPTPLFFFARSIKRIHSNFLGATKEMIWPSISSSTSSSWSCGSSKQQHSTHFLFQSYFGWSHLVLTPLDQRGQMNRSENVFGSFRFTNFETCFQSLMMLLSFLCNTEQFKSPNFATLILSFLVPRSLIIFSRIN
jgi:hypothetical protein